MRCPGVNKDGGAVGAYESWELAPRLPTVAPPSTGAVRRERELDQGGDQGRSIDPVRLLSPASQQVLQHLFKEVA